MNRTITTDFWLDTKVEEMSSTAKYMLLYLLTNPKTNLSGCYEVTYKRASNDTGLTTKQAESAIAELCEANVISYCAETNECLIYHWDRYNWTSSPKLDKPLVASISSVKHRPFAEWLVNKYETERGKDFPNKEDTLSSFLDTVSEKKENSRYDSISISIPIPIPSSSSKPNRKNETLEDEPKPPKHRHGQYGNVLLTDDELAKLKERFPADWEQRIGNLDEYIGYKGAKYKSHYLTIISWANRDAKKGGSNADNAYAGAW